MNKRKQTTLPFIGNSSKRQRQNQATSETGQTGEQAGEETIQQNGEQTAQQAEEETDQQAGVETDQQIEEQIDQQAGVETDQQIAQQNGNEENDTELNGTVTYTQSDLKNFVKKIKQDAKEAVEKFEEETNKKCDDLLRMIRTLEKQKCTNCKNEYAVYCTKCMHEKSQKAKEGAIAKFDEAIITEFPLPETPPSDNLGS